MTSARILGLTAVLSVAGCSKPDHACEVRGQLLTEDGVVGKQCALDLYLPGRADRLASLPLTTGSGFRSVIYFPILEPRWHWNGIVRCEGYQDTKTPAFEMNVGWLTCTPAEVGTITVKKVPS